MSLWRGVEMLKGGYWKMGRQFAKIRVVYSSNHAMTPEQKQALKEHLLHSFLKWH
jgi:hypothetical protein